jgi:predicted phage tail protein
MGVSQVPMNVLLLIAPTFAGIMRVIQGDYVFAFAVLGVCNVLGGVLFLMARKPAPPPDDQTRSAPTSVTPRTTGSDE